MSFPERRKAISMRAATSFPELFMANMGDFAGGCTTNDALREQIPIAFPDAGTSVDRPEGDHLFPQPCDGNPRARSLAGGNGEGKMAPTSTPSSGMSPSSVSASSGSISTSLSLTSTVSTVPTSNDTKTRPTAAPTTSTATVTTPHPSPSTSMSTSPSASPSSTFSTSTSSHSSAPTDVDGNEQCTEGHLTCLTDGTHFATCTGAKLTAPQPIAPGFKCSPGSGIGLDISPM